VSVIDTFVEAFDVSPVPVVNGVYVTMIVQLPPGAITVPLAQVPPAVIENVPVPAPVLAPSVGAAVSVTGPALVPVAVLLTVIVPGLAVVLPGVVVSAGVGALKATVPLSTVKVTPVVLAVPFAVVATVRV